MKYLLEDFGIGEKVKILETGEIGYDGLRYVLYATIDRLSRKRYLLELVGHMSIDDFDEQEAKDMGIVPLSWIVPTDMINALGTKTVPFDLPGNVQLKDVSSWPGALNGKAARLLDVDLIHDESHYQIKH